MSRLSTFLGIIAILGLGIAVAQERGAIRIEFPKAVGDEEKREKPVIKRRHELTDEDLRKQLQQVPELGFDQEADGIVLGYLTNLTTMPGTPIPQADLGPKYYAKVTTFQKKTEGNSLPWRTGVNSQMGKEVAEKMHVFSTVLRTSMRDAVPLGDVRPDPAKLKINLRKRLPNLNDPEGDMPLPWDKKEALPALVQMLQVENTAIRLLMVEMLAKIEGKESSEAIAQRALFDVSPEVRRAAADALAERPKKEYQQILIGALRWPWAPAADHAAEVIAALKLIEAVPDLVKMLGEPDPKLAYIIDAPKESRGTYVRELVRINHFCNCILCHAPSLSKDDLVRGRMPVPNEDPPAAYYQEQSGLFARADTVFLRQDFSLVQPVEKSGKWPGFQRYDYLLRTRKATAKEIVTLKAIQKENNLSALYPQRDAVLFALRELSGRDLGNKTEDWLSLSAGIEKKGEAK